VVRVAFASRGVPAKTLDSLSYESAKNYLRGSSSIDMPTHEVKNFSASTEVRRFDHGKIELVDIAGRTVARLVMQKGWRWSKDVKPVVKTEWCEAPHLQYIISGKLHVKMRDGTEFEVGPGDMASVPPGHDAWVIGDEPMVGVEFVGGRIAADGPPRTQPPRPNPIESHSGDRRPRHPDRA
jgi:hypothetical protein